MIINNKTMMVINAASIIYFSPLLFLMRLLVSWCILCCMSAGCSWKMWLYVTT